jgi:hypothetical protein
MIDHRALETRNVCKAFGVFLFVAARRLGVEMNFHAVTTSLLKQTNPNAIYRVSAKRISRMIHHPARAFVYKQMLC